MIEIFTNDQSLLLHANDRWSEVSPLTGWSSETLAECLEALFEEDFDRYPSTSFAIDMLFVETTPKFVPFTALLSGTPAEIFAQAKTTTAQAAKVKLGSLDFEQAFHVVTKLLGWGMRLRLDFNRQWSLDDACAFANAFPEGAIDYFEEPTCDLTSFCNETNQPIALDESIFSHISWELPNLKSIILKPCLWGSIGDCLELAQLTYQKNKQLVLSNPYKTLIGLKNLLSFAQLIKKPLQPIGLGMLNFPDFSVNINLNEWERIGAVSPEPAIR